MSRQDRGDYINLLCAAWNSDEPGTLSLPLSLGAKEAGIRPQILRSFLTRFPEVFVEFSGRLVNEKLHRQWLRYKEISEKRAKVAKDGRAIAEQMRQQKGGSAVAVAVAVAPANSNTKSNSFAQTPGASELFGFAIFWEAYPKKVGRPAAKKAWLSKVKVDDRYPEVIAGLEMWKQSEQWQDAQFIPYPATFLNQQRWQDQVPKNGGTKNDQRIARTVAAFSAVATKYGVSLSGNGAEVAGPAKFSLQSGTHAARDRTVCKTVD